MTIDALATAVRRHAADVRVIADLNALSGAVADLAERGDLIVTLGAGSIGAVGDRILNAINLNLKSQPLGEGVRPGRTKVKP